MLCIVLSANKVAKVVALLLRVSNIFIDLPKKIISESSICRAFVSNLGKWMGRREMEKIKYFCLSTIANLLA